METILATAPGQPSIDAAHKLLAPRHWPTLAGDGDGILWGECQGSGSQPYRVALAETDLGYRCSCPSIKFPCKHVLALMWMRVDGRSFPSEPRPQWVVEWLAKRRVPAPSDEAAKDVTAPALSLPIVPAERVTDPKATARAAVQRERNRAERETLVLAALDELDLWITDQLERGLATFQGEAQQQCRLVARRLVDGKAGGLATRVERLPSLLAGLPDAVRADALVERLGCLHLIAQAYRRQSLLPAGLTADVRAAVGWTIPRESLLADPAVLRRRARWHVLAAVTEVQPDKLRRLETWLGAAEPATTPSMALLIDFVPVSVSAARSYAVGETIEAELAFYPSAAPLRALVAQQFGPSERNGSWSAPGDDIGAALDRYDATLAVLPWLGDFPLAVRDALVIRQGDRLALCHRAGGPALPIRWRDDEAALPLVGCGEIDAFGLWDGRRLDLRYAKTPLGTWMAEL